MVLHLIQSKSPSPCPDFIRPYVPLQSHLCAVTFCPFLTILLSSSQTSLLALSWTRQAHYDLRAFALLVSFPSGDLHGLLLLFLFVTYPHGRPTLSPFTLFIFLSGLYYPLTFDLLISWIVFCPLYDLEQGCPIEGSAIVEMFSIRAVHYGPNNPCGYQHLNVASESEELDFELGWILINLNVSSRIRLMATILNSTGQFRSMIINRRNIYIIWISNIAFRNLSQGTVFLLKNVHCMVIENSEKLEII